MTVTRVPASNPEPEEVPTHWIAGESSLTWNNPVTAIACGAEGDGVYTLDKVTCAECLNVVMRRRCLVLEDAPGPLRQRCTRPVHDDDRHSWRWDSAGLPGSTSTEQDTPSGRLPPVRTPGAALRDEEGSDGPGGPGESARPGESILGRRVIERWPA